MSTTKIADQIGCTQQHVSKIKGEVTTTCNLPDRVTGKDGKSYPASKRLPAEKIADVEERLRGRKARRTLGRCGCSRILAVDGRYVGRTAVASDG